jgi:hypothetical protein
MGTRDCAFIARVGMTHDPRRRIVPEHPLDAARSLWSSVGYNHHACVLRIADTDASAVMQRDPCGPAGTVSSALSSGQSDTASEPSRIASVSRFGLATEPLSR